MRAWILCALVAAGCGGGENVVGTRAPGAACDTSVIDDPLNCQAAPGTNCHTCVSPHDGVVGVPTTHVGFCAFECDPNGPNTCPSGQTCMPFGTSTGYLARGCNGNVNGYCH
jgi:hypothetical protein